MSDLPREIIEQILLRIPARSLLSLILVCKQWKSLISDPNFIKNHAKHASLDRSNSHSKLIMNWKTEDDWVTEDEDSINHSAISQSIDYESLNSTNFELEIQTSTTPVILGSCNGLLLVGIYDTERREFDTRVLWNPLFTKKYRVLPPCISFSSHRTRMHGFGYSPAIDDFKFVALNKNRYTNTRSLCHSYLQVEVYSLKTDSWKVISGIPDSDSADNVRVSFRINAGTCVQGSIYWTIGDAHSSVIIAFDLVTENFKLIEAPRSDDHVYRCGLFNIVNVRGLLGAYSSDKNADETVIWIWNEDENKKGFWTKQLRIPTEHQMVKRILSFINNNEVLLHVVGPATENLVIYDLESKIIRDIPCGNFEWPVHMVETLVSPVSGETVIWIWNEDEKKKVLWTRLLGIATEHQMIKHILSFITNNEVLLHVTGSVTENLVICDLESNMFRDISCGNFELPVHTVETLVSPVSS